MYTIYNQTSLRNLKTTVSILLSHMLLFGIMIEGSNLRKTKFNFAFTNLVKSLETQTLNQQVQ